ncbi:MULTISPECIES: cell envelope integrity protein TolA [Pseudoalteromonas]|jgi:colicin import membrane protein|uniref:TolA protein n=1 Tax=Pseudoalteromonas translucida (strain TAC 125) TaxID=326442 RepID=Q3IIJ5_PSET1|nr:MULTISPECIES: cell envelope integrity protein TolA [Pseudoalteromonas]MBB1371449.1 cell envelope integrity protein TolA [Pseudoalteromonas sp. SR45-4]MBB1404480.1 cell envelope integrity protein TolA [Pseudoalteromonas sp. SG44-5]MBE0421743.1 cell envelope integrity protein TolA [Pseudoalteromonas nigrifaciens]MBH0073672.1 cell envelope integrity protein TolA [Pseudoalteromonas sp. NZS127]MBH0094467.1 cell envelope integrity protein TolA [Pseudoalteromonas sp. SCQQ13]|tara:strand:- start:3034 stop:3939 length:906 start_codon:yes stop_codon:yes gene_type:complete
MQTPLIKSVLLHVALGGFLYATANIHPPAPKVMEVTLNSAIPDVDKAVSAVTVDQKQVEQKIAQLRKKEDDQKRAEDKRIRDLERRASNARKERESEARQIKKLEQQRKAKEKETAEAQAQAKKARAIEQQERAKAKQAEKQKQESENAAKAAADKRKAEEDALKKAQAERKKREAEAERKREQAMQEQMLQEQLAKEQAARSKIRQQQVVSEVDKYRALIMARIQQNLLIDEKMKNQQCRVNIRLGFNGLVTQVTSLGGDRLVCEAALRAVRMADTLPVSKDKDVFDQLKNINLTIKPEF